MPALSEANVPAREVQLLPEVELLDSTVPVHMAVVSYTHLHSPRYAASIAAHPRARLAAIVGMGQNAEVARAEAQRYGVPFMDALDDLLALPALDGLYVGAGPLHHPQIVAWAAAHGVHLLCDKPLAVTLAAADAIVATVRSAGIKLMVPFNPRYQLPLIQVRQALQRGEAGDLVSIYAVKYGRLPTRAVGPQDASWFLDPAQAGGGSFLDIGIHAIDAMRWLANGAEATRVYAQVGAVIHEHLQTDDLGVMTVEFDNGVVGVLSAGWANPDSYPTWLDVRFEILTTKRAYLIDSPYHDFWLYGARAERRYWWRRDIDGLVDEFISAILQDRDPAITAEDARAALAIALAAYASARQGQVVGVG